MVNEQLDVHPKAKDRDCSTGGRHDAEATMMVRAKLHKPGVTDSFFTPKCDSCYEWLQDSDDHTVLKAEGIEEYYRERA